MIFAESFDYALANTASASSAAWLKDCSKSRKAGSNRSVGFVAATGPQVVVSISGL
jgi:hypothetical protein